MNSRALLYNAKSYKKISFLIYFNWITMKTNWKLDFSIWRKWLVRRSVDHLLLRFSIPIGAVFGIILVRPFVRSELKLWVLPVAIQFLVVRAQTLIGISPAHESEATLVEFLTHEKPHLIFLNINKFNIIHTLIHKIRITRDSHIQ